MSHSQQPHVTNFGDSEPHRLRSRHETAEFLGVSVGTLERWDRQGYGPRPVKIGPRRVGYRTRDLIEFIETKLADAAA
jgi:predicted DNA-binding transcriptional regulator AlpA